MVERFNDEDRDRLRSVTRIQEYIKKEILPRISPEEVESLLQESGKAKKTMEELLTNVVDVATGMVDKSAGRHVTEFDTEELREFAKNTLAEGLKQEAALQQLRRDLDARLKPYEDQISVDVKTKSNLALRHALRRVFGKTTNVITFEMYKQAKELMTRLHEEDLTEFNKDSPIGMSNVAEKARSRKATEATA